VFCAHTDWRPVRLNPIPNLLSNQLPFASKNDFIDLVPSPAGFSLHRERLPINLSTLKTGQETSVAQKTIPDGTNLGRRMAVLSMSERGERALAQTVGADRYVQIS
jgi:hypothetical protein